MEIGADLEAIPIAGPAPFDCWETFLPHAATGSRRVARMRRAVSRPRTTDRTVAATAGTRTHHRLEGTSPRQLPATWPVSGRLAVRDR
jgi:hypothetical protein